MSHEKDYLPLFKSPLIQHESSNIEYTGNGSPPPHEHNPKHLPTRITQHHDDQSFHDTPQFHRHAETTHSELFYDLFFVANLTVFTAIHDINDGSSLKQYIGFFCVLWFTWYQVGLYDVRFSEDSAFERVAKAAHFLIMIAFSIIGPKFDVGSQADDSEKGPDVGYFKALTLVLMISRVVLVLQYLQAMYFTRRYKKTLMPMGLIVATYAVAAIIYMGLYFSFHEGNIENELSYIAWYIVAIMETVVATTVFSISKTVNFNRTHLIERMSLLTLIILGEGIMGIAKTCQKIVKSEKELSFSASTVGNIICGVLILYFLFMLYFDWMQEEDFGTIRQQIWSALHFPLHLSLVLAVEGINQAIAWRASVVRGNKFMNQFQHWIALETSWDTVVEEVTSLTDDLIYASLGSAKGYAQIRQGLYDLDGATNATDIIREYSENVEYSANLEEANDALRWVSQTLYNTIYSIGGFIPPEDPNSQASTWVSIDFSDSKSSEEVEQQMLRQAEVFALTFTYFFVTVGLTVILCCLIAAISRREKAKFHWFRIGASSIIGLGLCLVSTMSASDSDALANFLFSPWVLPTVTISLFAVVLLNCVKPAEPLTRPARRH